MTFWIRRVFKVNNLKENCFIIQLCVFFLAATKFQLSLTPPDFAQYKVNDLFRSLGPIAIFSAKRHWTAPRLVQLQRNKNSEGFGFSVRGDAPVIVAAVEQKSIAEVNFVNLLIRLLPTNVNSLHKVCRNV